MHKSEDEEEDEIKYFLIQQIPRSIPSFKKKMKNLKIIETQLYQKLMRVQGMSNLVFDVDQIIDDKASPDVWVVYNCEDDLDKYYSLH